MASMACIMGRMGNLRFTVSSQVMADPKVKHALRMRLLALEPHESTRFDGADVSIQAATNALWLWFTRMEEGEARDFISRRMRELEAFMRGEQAPAEELDLSDDDGNSGTRPKRKRRSS